MPSSPGGAASRKRQEEPGGTRPAPGWQAPIQLSPATEVTRMLVCAATRAVLRRARAIGIGCVALNTTSGLAPAPATAGVTVARAVQHSGDPSQAKGSARTPHAPTKAFGALPQKPDGL